MKTAIVTLALCGMLTACVIGAERTASVSGDWSAKETWGGEAVPADGDTVVVKDGVTVTVSDERIIGTSGAKGTLAVNLNKTGELVIAKGGLLRVRGDTAYTPAATQPAVTVQGGGTWRWDASKAAAPKETQYKFYGTDQLAFRALILAGTKDARATYDSDPAGGAGYQTMGGKAYGGPFKAEYADIARIGDAKTPGWDFWSPGGEGVLPVFWDVRNTTFTNCGAISSPGWIPADLIFRHSNNVHTGTQSPRVFSNILASGTAGKGVREIIGNVFDVAVAETTMTGGFTIRGNYFGNGIYIHGSQDPWASCEGNFYRLIKDGTASCGGKKFSDSYVFIDMDQDNPHVVPSPNKYACDMDGLVMSHGGTANVDSGEWIFGSHEFLITRCIILPNIYGYSSGEMGVITGDWLDQFPKFEHNTWFGGFAKGAATDTGFPAFQYSESGNNKPGQVKSFRSNIMWNPQIASQEGNFVKMLDVHSTGKDQKDGPVQDVGDPVNLDYNTGWGYTKEPSFPNVAHFTNMGKGYIGKWSKTPGEHDVDVDPQFQDYQRDVILYATKGLGKTASRGQWTAKPDKPYAVGDTVINTTKILWGLPIMYRYIGTGENPEPGLGTRAKGDTGAWRNSWEWASLYYIREGVRTGQKFGDDGIIMHLLKWVRAGYAPTNPALKGAAHDGKDIGAVPWQAKTATQPATAPANK